MYQEMIPRNAADRREMWRRNRPQFTLGAFMELTPMSDDEYLDNMEARYQEKLKADRWKRQMKKP